MVVATSKNGYSALTVLPNEIAESLPVDLCIVAVKSSMLAYSITAPVDGPPFTVS